MKKMMKLNQNSTGEYSFEEIVSFYSNYLNKAVSIQFEMLKKMDQHTIHIDKEDVFQYALIGLNKAYNNYNYYYKSDNPDDKYDEQDHMGFFPYMDRMVKGEIKRYCRDELKLRRKDYNMHEIKMSSLNAPVVSNNNGDDKEMFYSDIIEDNFDGFNELLDTLEIESILDLVDTKERDLIYDRFFNDMTQVELAKKYKVTQVQISRNLTKILKKIKERIEMKKKNANKRAVNRINPMELAQESKTKTIMPEIKNTDLEPKVHITMPELKPELEITQTPTIVVENNALSGLRVKNMEIEFDCFSASFNNKGLVMDLYDYDEEELNVLTIEDLERFKSDIDKAINLLKMFKS